MKPHSPDLYGDHRDTIIRLVRCRNSSMCQLDAWESWTATGIITVSRPLLSIPMHDHPPLKLIDSFGRVHNNLRISVTDRCNIRCVYCMPESISFLPRRELLTFEEIERFVRALVPLGINKLRLTGGEPLLRRDLPTLVDKLAKIPGISDVGLTTNGMQLARMAQKLWDAGLRRIKSWRESKPRDRLALIR